MRTPGLKFYCAYRPEFLGFELDGWKHEPDGRVTFIQGVTLETIDPRQDRRGRHSALVLDDGEAQSLFEALWGAGFRPRRHEDAAGALQATQTHLADMRRLVASALKVDLPEQSK